MNSAENLLKIMGFLGAKKLYFESYSDKDSIYTVKSEDLLDCNDIVHVYSFKEDGRGAHYDKENKQEHLTEKLIKKFIDNYRDKVNDKAERMIQITLRDEFLLKKGLDFLN